MPNNLVPNFLDFQITSTMASGSPLLRNLFNNLVKGFTEVKEVEEEVEEKQYSPPRDRSYSVTSTDSGYCEGSSKQGQKTLSEIV